MGLFDKAGDLAKQHHEKIEGIIEQAGDFVDGKTGSKYAEHVDKAQDFANQQLDNVTGPDTVPPASEDIPPTTPVPNP